VPATSVSIKRRRSSTATSTGNNEAMLGVQGPYKLCDAETAEALRWSATMHACSLS
jgi:hypothetical protein